MIIGKDICKRFGNQVIFENFNFEIHDGEFVCFSGDSGAGKTTLLNIIGLLEPIDSGHLIINGKEYQKSKDIRRFYQKEVGFLFQNFALVENKTVKQNLDLVIQKKNSEMTIDKAMQRVGLNNKLNSKVYTLSGGEQQRVSLARLILKECNLILADEPTGSLDKRNAQIVMNILRNLNKEGKTIIIVTHDEEIKKQVDRRIEL